jgi:hypothetical protein
MSFTAASSQYATKASPTGITFTSAFTCEAWVYLNSYQGHDQFIIGRTDNSTGGLGLCVRSTGQLKVLYGASSAFTENDSYQSIPLNRWVHVAATATVASKTVNIYINGTLIPSTQSASSATSLTQTSNLSVGAAGAGLASTFFDGYISEARVWSVAQTQASIQANMGINCVGTETNLVALFQGNGAWTDGTTNANTLTATGGATFVTANPYHTTEYGIITKVTSSQLTVFTGTDYVLPSTTNGLQNFYYSTQRAPYGFPAGKEKWIVDVLLLSQVGTSGTSTNTMYNPGGLSLNVPTGSWIIDGQLGCYISPNNTITNYAAGLSTSSSAFIVGSALAHQYTQEYVTSSGVYYSLKVTDRALLNTATPYYLLMESASAFTTLSFNGSTSTSYPDITKVTAECSYI